MNMNTMYECVFFPGWSCVGCGECKEPTKQDEDKENFIAHVEHCKDPGCDCSPLSARGLEDKGEYDPSRGPF